MVRVLGVRVVSSTMAIVSLAVLRDTGSASLILHEKGIRLKPFWSWRLLHEFFSIASKEHALYSILLPERFGFDSLLI